MARPHSAPRERVWDTAIEQFAACTMECIPVTVQYTCYLKYYYKRETSKFECEWRGKLKHEK